MRFILNLTPLPSLCVLGNLPRFARGSVTLKSKGGERIAEAAVTRHDFYIVVEACIENEHTALAVDEFLDRIPQGLWMDIFCDLCDLAVD